MQAQLSHKEGFPLKHQQNRVVFPGGEIFIWESVQFLEKLSILWPKLLLSQRLKYKSLYSNELN